MSLFGHRSNRASNRASISPSPSSTSPPRPAYIYTQLHCSACGVHIADHGVLLPLSGRTHPHISFAPTIPASLGQRLSSGSSNSSTTSAHVNAPSAPRVMRDDTHPIVSAHPGRDLVTWYPALFAAGSTAEARPVSPSVVLGQTSGGVARLLRTAGVTLARDEDVPVVLVLEGCRAHGDEGEPESLGGEWRVVQSWECSESSSVA